MTVYDKGKYHDDSVAGERLPPDHADHHIVFFLRWLIDNDLMSDDFTSGEPGHALDEFKTGRRSICWLFQWWDRVLACDMLSDDVNAFAVAYFDYDHGDYLHDYEELLAGSVPTTFHVEYMDKNHARPAARISERWAAFSSRSPDV